LVDWSGRSVIEGTRGSIPHNLPSIPDRLKIDRDNSIGIDQSNPATSISQRHRASRHDAGSCQ